MIKETRKQTLSLKSFLTSVLVLISATQIILGNTISQAADVNEGQAHGRMAREYQEAEQAAKDAKMAESILIPLWTVAGVICTVGCFAIFEKLAGAPFEVLCGYLSILAGVTDIAMTIALKKSYQDAMAGLLASGVIGVPFVLTGTWAGVTPAGKSSARVFSCVSMVVDFIMVASHSFGLVESISAESDAKKNRKQVQALSMQKPSTILDTKANLAVDRSGATAARPGAVVTDGETETSSGPASNSPISVCAGNKKAGNFEATVSCAQAFDKRLPKGLTNPKVMDAFKELTNMTPGQFISKLPENATGSQALAAGFAAAKLGDPQKLKPAFDDIMAKMLNNNKSMTEASFYATSGTGQKAGGGSRGGGADAMATIFGQKGTANEYKNTNELSFGSKSYDQIFGDPTIDLFDRVSARYNLSRHKISELPWAIPYNRSINQ